MKIFLKGKNSNSNNNKNIEVARRTVGQTVSRSLRGMFDTVARYGTPTPPPGEYSDWVTDGPCHLMLMLWHLSWAHDHENKTKPDYRQCIISASASASVLESVSLCPKTRSPCRSLYPFGVMLFPLQMTYTCPKLRPETMPAMWRVVSCSIYFVFVFFLPYGEPKTCSNFGSAGEKKSQS